MNTENSELTQAQQDEFNRQYNFLSFGASEITPDDEFRKMLTKSIVENKPLRVKLGIDPTSPDIHLGHMATFKKMRQFQDMGHKGVVIIGDYTAQIGDPTGKNESRPSLTHEDTKANAEKYMEQVYYVLDKEKTEIRYQSEWFSDIDLKTVLSWAGQTTVAKLVSHETFKNRLESGAMLGLHEFFYPVLQGIDSVYVEADVELGGTDQKFNVLMGRDYLKNKKMRPQVALLLPLVIGTDGKDKMSKSLGNYIGVLDEPFDKFGKVMSIPDELMENYAKYLADFSPEEAVAFINDLKAEKLHPNEAKKQLAIRIVAQYHGLEAGQQMREQFERVFAKKKLPDEVPEYKFERGDDLIAVLTKSKLLASNGEVRRMVKQNAVSIVDGDKIQDAAFAFDDSMTDKVIKVGKRKFLKLT